MGALLSLPLLAVPSVGTVCLLPSVLSDCKSAEWALIIALVITASVLRSQLLRCCDMLDGMQCLWQVWQQVRP